MQTAAVFAKAITVFLMSSVYISFNSTVRLSDKFILITLSLLCALLIIIIILIIIVKRKSELFFIRDFNNSVLKHYLTNYTIPNFCAILTMRKPFPQNKENGYFLCSFSL